MLLIEISLPKKEVRSDFSISIANENNFNIKSMFSEQDTLLEAKELDEIRNLYFSDTIPSNSRVISNTFHKSIVTLISWLINKEDDNFKSLFKNNEFAFDYGLADLNYYNGLYSGPIYFSFPKEANFFSEFTSVMGNTNTNRFRKLLTELGKYSITTNHMTELALLMHSYLISISMHKYSNFESVNLLLNFLPLWTFQHSSKNSTYYNYMMSTENGSKFYETLKTMFLENVSIEKQENAEVLCQNAEHQSLESFLEEMKTRKFSYLTDLINLNLEDKKALGYLNKVVNNLSSNQKFFQSESFDAQQLLYKVKYTKMIISNSIGYFTLGHNVVEDRPKGYHDKRATISFFTHPFITFSIPLNKNLNDLVYEMRAQEIKYYFSFQKLAWIHPHIAGHNVCLGNYIFNFKNVSLSAFLMRFSDYLTACGAHETRGSIIRTCPRLSQPSKKWLSQKFRSLEMELNPYSLYRYLSTLQ